MTNRILRIESTVDEPGASWIERYLLLDSRGGWRRLKKIPGNGQYAPGDDELIAWFERLGVTHVDVATGWHETVLAKKYSLKVFARHLRRVREST